MTKKELELYNAIDEIIWKDWDPIGVNDSKEGRDEYHGYLPTLFKQIVRGKNKKGISNYLFHTATVNIGTKGNREREDKVAALLIAKRIEIIGI